MLFRGETEVRPIVERGERLKPPRPPRLGHRLCKHFRKSSCLQLQSTLWKSLSFSKVTALSIQ